MAATHQISKEEERYADVALGVECAWPDRIDLQLPDSKPDSPPSPSLAGGDVGELI